MTYHLYVTNSARASVLEACTSNLIVWSILTALHRGAPHILTALHIKYIILDRSYKQYCIAEFIFIKKMVWKWIKCIYFKPIITLIF